jgi:hypothetical protein
MLEWSLKDKSARHHISKSERGKREDTLTTKIELDAIYAVSEDVVSREIEGELIIVPLVAGIGSMDDELYTMNDTGRAIWKGLDGKKTLRTLVGELSSQFDAAPEEIRKDAVGLLEELLKRKMVVEKK